MDEDSEKGKVFSDVSLGCLLCKASCFLFFDQECYIMVMLAMKLIFVLFQKNLWWNQDEQLSRAGR